MLSSPETTSWLLGSLSSALPGSLCNFALHFWDYDSERIFLDEKARRFWKTLDKILSNTRFPALMNTEIMWNLHHSCEDSESDLINKYQQGIFKKFFPDLYTRGVLWCGHRNRYVVYPAVEHAFSLALTNPEEWRKLCRGCLFPRGYRPSMHPPQAIGRFG